MARTSLVRFGWALLPAAMLLAAGCSSNDSSPASSTDTGVADTFVPDSGSADLGTAESGSPESGAGGSDAGADIADTGPETAPPKDAPGGDSADAPANATKWTVNVTSNAFDPAEITIMAGDSVEWVWKDGRHNVTSGDMCMSDGLFTSGDPMMGGVYTRRFDEVGEFPYFCVPHCEGGMTGTVIVE